MSEPSQGTLPGVEAQRGDIGSDACFSPKYIIDGVAEALGGEISTDPCWHVDSHVPDGHLRYDGQDRGDGLSQPWEYSLWMNPPYSDPLPWADRFAAHAERELRYIALVKLDCTTEWWRVLVGSRSRPSPTLIGLVDHRIKFEGSFAGGGTPSFASAFITAGILAPRLKRALPFANWLENA